MRSVLWCVSLFVPLILLSWNQVTVSGLFKGKGAITFRSEAQLETIEARSDQLKGYIDFTKKTFAFRIPMKSFNGFNSPLQQTHFNEHYLESAKYPIATFSGRLLQFDPGNSKNEYKNTSQRKT